MVGCVIVGPDGQVIGEGYHQEFGGPHAEPNALAECLAGGHSPKGATAYVSLEPCCHTNKKTPPCVPKLIEAGLARVVVGCLDPNPEVNGKGVAMLRAAGIRVDGPILERPAKQLIAPFIARTVHRRPYVTLKWAQTADGKVAGGGGRRMQISNERSMRVVHELRAWCDGIVVGINTAIIDNPMLTARHVDGARPLTRFVLDSELLLPLDSRLVRTAGESPVLVACLEEEAAAHPERVRALRDAGVGLMTVEGVPGRRGVPLAGFLESFAENDEEGSLPTHLLVEPGPTLAKSFFQFADRIWVFGSPRVVADPTAPSAAAIPPHYVVIGQVTLGDDTLKEYLNSSSSAFFATEPSADLVLIGERSKHG
jgi:diaminohydroxyphosphoribosylaminopyrimidine deaminase/5-amino-6-(5-phosphoribosylamino)uracil reductase